MKISFTEVSDAQKLEISDIITRLERKKTLEWCMIRICKREGFRFFIRECYGHVEHYRWLSEKQIRAWLWSAMEGHKNYEIQMRKHEKSKQEKLESSRRSPPPKQRKNTESDVFDALRETCPA